MTVERSRQISNINIWGEGYFAINDEGEIVVRPQSDAEEYVLLNILAAVKENNKYKNSWPLLLRFPDILRHRAKQIKHEFIAAQQQFSYDANYTLAYPIKVNQQQDVLEALLQDDHDLGLEVGSKPELLIALSVQKTEQIIICNGYKDEQYITLALLGYLLNLRIIIVIDKITELDLILKLSRQLKITPIISLRMRLHTKCNSKWQNSGGPGSKFGLTYTELLHATNILQKNNQLQILQMLHFHLGSQVTNLSDIEHSLCEALTVYGELTNLGANLNTIDLGGGLGIDYLGNKSEHFCSRNYGLTEYAQTIIRTIKNYCKQYKMRLPHIITESGRALVAHHAVLITNILEVEKTYQQQFDINLININNKYVKKLDDLLKQIQQHNDVVVNMKYLSDIYTQAKIIYEASLADFMQRNLSLDQYVLIDKKYANFMYQLREIIQNVDNKNIDDQLLEQLKQELAHKFFVNLSIFKSLPDIWGVNQVFPILPLHHLNKPLLQLAILHDLTCDSDGKISQYIHDYKLSKALALPNVSLDLLAFFLVGAYQEVLGDIHNLFGNTNTMNITFDNNKIIVDKMRQGDTVESILQQVNFDIDDVVKKVYFGIDKLQVSENDKINLMHKFNHYINSTTYML